METLKEDGCSYGNGDGNGYGDGYGYSSGYDGDGSGHGYGNDRGNGNSRGGYVYIHRVPETIPLSLLAAVEAHAWRH